jgi:hypothetical protein
LARRTAEPRACSPSAMPSRRTAARARSTYCCADCGPRLGLVPERKLLVRRSSDDGSAARTRALLHSRKVGRRSRFRRR